MSIEVPTFETFGKQVQDQFAAAGLPGTITYSKEGTDYVIGYTETDPEWYAFIVLQDQIIRMTPSSRQGIETALEIKANSFLRYCKAKGKGFELNYGAPCPTCGDSATVVRSKTDKSAWECSAGINHTRD